MLITLEQREPEVKRVIAAPSTYKELVASIEKELGLKEDQIVVRFCADEGDPFNTRVPVSDNKEYATFLKFQPRRNLLIFHKPSKKEDQSPGGGPGKSKYLNLRINTGKKVRSRMVRARDLHALSCCSATTVSWLCCSMCALVSGC